ncbi:hypothetical protein DFH06DRAFT_1153989 [Mycena polygramma]|nr:hypothetical protein DFH06DRAFT_1153989 [Mycena polygramma]
MACLYCRKRRIRVSSFVTVQQAYALTRFTQCVTDGAEGSRCERCAQKELDCEYVPVSEDRDKPLVVTNPEGKAKRSPPPTPSLAHPGIATQAYPHEYRSTPSTYVSSSRPRTQPTPSSFYPARGLSLLSPTPLIRTPQLRLTFIPPRIDSHSIRRALTSTTIPGPTLRNTKHSANFAAMDGVTAPDNEPGVKAAPYITVLLRKIYAASVTPVDSNTPYAAK